MLTIAFDLDETLGVPVLQAERMIGFQLRTGCADLLARLQRQHWLVLWSVSNRRYVEKALAFGMAQFFVKVYTWDEIPWSWKDVRQLQIDLLIDDSDYHLRQAEKHGIAERYILVPAYGSPEDSADPLRWIDTIESRLANE